MKKSLLPFASIFFMIFSLQAQTPCSGGSAGVYPCDGYDLQSSFDLSVLSAGAGNDSWGWTDPSNGDEYAIVGLDNGTVFIDVSNPTNPVYLGKLPTHTSSSTWRDVKVYNNHAFVVSEAGGHGMQVFDLTRLRSVTSPPVTFTEDAHYNGFGSAHNIVINEDSGYAYPVGANQFNGGPIFINIQNPTNPIFEGGYGMDAYSHDAQIVTYCGPDADYNGREIMIGSNANEVVIVDISDKSNPVGIATIDYTDVGYTHQGWFTEDQSFFLLGDETDERDLGYNTRTIVFDLRDLDNPSIHFEYESNFPAIDHNGYVNGDKFYLSNYRAGLRVFDISDIANQNIVEEGFFDSFPNNNNVGFSGAWSVYPYFASGNIVISDINRGFFLVKAISDDNTPPIANCGTATVTLDANGTGVLVASDADNGSTDNIGVAGFLACDKFFDCADLGTQMVEIEVYDAFGNRDFCTATVTVVDSLAPTLSCPADEEVQNDPGQNFYTVPDYVALGEVSATDNCSTGLTITQDPVAGTQLPAGNYFIVFESTDDSSNTGSCQFQLAVEVPLSVDDNTLDSGLSIFPNPASEKITIQSNNAGINTIHIVDISGKIIFSEESNAVQSKTIDLSSYAQGVYFVHINNAIAKKVIKR
ncbi:choice-of-anchor B family protein [Rasiella rasia]|uniref:Choice-of-anchor B family protein n=1 Tax=Rasiella rasia TaxID=2744027 RepID=A0A6G6GMH5_9FLAO|nr:choice-of-anchor B family protein [Rasiella rasia]QIE59613.1 choice-of-anchor B family protein [Rasiella rasia]